MTFLSKLRGLFGKKKEEALAEVDWGITGIIEKTPEEKMEEKIIQRKVKLTGSRVMQYHYRKVLSKLLVECQAEMLKRGFQESELEYLTHVPVGLHPDTPLLTTVSVTARSMIVEGSVTRELCHGYITSKLWSLSSGEAKETLVQNTRAIQELKREQEELQQYCAEKSAVFLAELAQKGLLYVRGPGGRFKKCGPAVTPQGVMKDEDWDLGPPFLFQTASAHSYFSPGYSLLDNPRIVQQVPLRKPVEEPRPTALESAVTSCLITTSCQ